MKECLNHFTRGNANIGQFVVMDNDGEFLIDSCFQLTLKFNLIDTNGYEKIGRDSMIYGIL